MGMYQPPGIRVSRRDLKSSRSVIGLVCERYVAKSSGSANYKEIHSTGHLASILTCDNGKILRGETPRYPADLIMPVLDMATTSYRQ